jgi:hypothetical protein
MAPELRDFPRRKKEASMATRSRIESAGRMLTLLVLLALPSAPASGYYLDTRNGTRHALRVDAPSWGTGAQETPAEGPADWTFGPNVPVSTGPGNRLWPDLIALPDGKLYASWMDDRTGTYHIYGAQSVDGGHTWSADQRIDDAPGSSMARFVSLAVLGPDRIGAVWEDVRAGGWNWNVFFARGIWNAGAGRFDWSASTRVNTTGGSTDAGSYMHPSIDADRFGRVYVAWTDWRDGVFYQVWFRSSTDGGTTWNGEVRISDQIGYEPVAGDPCLAVDPRDAADPPALLCVWNDWRGYAPGGRYPNVYFARSTDGGLSWSNPNVPVNDVTNYYQQAAKRVIATTSAGTIAVGWFNDDFVGPSEMRVSRSTDLGASWGTSAVLSEAVTGAGVCPNLAGGMGEDLLASWPGYAADWNIYFRASTDGGGTWSLPQRIDDDATGAASDRPIIAVLPFGNPVLVSQDSRPTPAWAIWAEPGLRNPAALDGEVAFLPVGLSVGPNPAGGPVTLRWNMPAAQAVRLRVVDPGGRVLLDRRVPARERMTWNPTEGAGLAPGVYYVILDQGARRERSKLILLR